MKLSLVLTYDCNMKCSYCNVVKSKNYMKLDVFLDIVNFFKSDINSIAFIGGEPLLNKEVFIKILKYAIENDIKLELVTNGTLIDKEIINILRKNQELFKVIISLDGDIKTNNFNKKFINQAIGNNVYSNILSNIKNDVGLFSVHMVIDSLNTNKISENFKHLSSLGFKEISIGLVLNIEWTKNQLQSLMIGLDDILRFCIKNNEKKISFSSMKSENLYCDINGNLYKSAIITSIKDTELEDQLCIGNIYNGINRSVIINERKILDEFYGNKSKVYNKLVLRIFDNFQKRYEKIKSC